MLIEATVAVTHASFRLGVQLTEAVHANMSVSAIKRPTSGVEDISSSRQLVSKHYS